MKGCCFLVVLLSTATLMSVRQGSCQEEINLLCDAYHTDRGILNGTDKCLKTDHTCFVLWREELNERNETVQIVIKKGCLTIPAHSPLRHCQDDCIQHPDYAVFKSADVSGFCCCKVNMCNKNFTPVYDLGDESTVAPSSSAGEFVCEVVADVAFLVDSSGSVGRGNWVKMKQFLKDLVKAFNVGPNKTHIAAVAYSTRADLEFKFDTLKGSQVTEAGYYSLIDRIEFQRGFTFIDKALILADQQVFQRWAGMRAELRQIAIVITYGRQTVHTGLYTPLADASSGLKLKKVQVYSLGIGSNVDRKQLEDIASSKDKVFFATSFAELAPLAQTIVQNSCPGTVEKEPRGLTLMEITILSAVGSVIFIVLAALAAILFKKHRAGRKPNIPDDAAEEEITPYATVRLSSIFPLNAENNGPGDIPLRTLPFQLRTPPEERATGETDLRNSPYENTDHLGRSSVNRLEYLYYQPRYENEVVDSETRDVVIRPGYDKLVYATRKKRRENGGAHLGRRLPCGMVDTHCLSVYDSLVRETDLRCKSRRGDTTDSESEDEHSPACSVEKKKNQENSLGDIEFGCTGNDSTTSDVQDEVKPGTSNLSPRTQAAFKMEDQPGLFEFYSSDRTEDADHEQTADEENARDEGTSEI